MSQSYAKSPAAERKFTTREMVLVGMFAAVLAVISQISLPMPTGVPITIQVFGVALVGAVLGSRLGTTATLVYVLLGAIGLPIFANFSGGISSIVGVTGGYIWAWPIMTWLCGIRPKTENKTKNLAISIGFALIGLLIVETIGGLQWHFVGGSMSIPAIAVYSLTAFIPKDIVITVLAVISQISLPMPTGVPITIQVFGVALVGAVLGSRLGTTATLVYVLLGAIGLPIFANFSGGISSIVGVTGGYIWAWPIMTWLCGIRPKTENKTKNLAISIVFALIGLLIVETIGGLQWHFVGGSMSIPAIAVYSLTAFIPKDIVITVLAVLIAIPIRKGINNAGNR